MATTNLNTTIAITTTTTATTGNNNINNNSNHNHHINSSTSNHNNSNNNISSTTVITPITATTTTVDAATVAIAKDMLQLHHGGGAATLNNNNNNNVTDASILHASPTNVVLTTTSATTPPTPGANAIVVTAAAMSSSTPPHSNNNSNNNNIPPAHIIAGANINATIAAAAAAANSVGAVSSLTPAPTSASPPNGALGLLKFNEDILYITDSNTVIGRNSSTSMVHFHVAENNLVSRKHFQVLFDAETRAFYVQCLSKNGIFVDDFLQRRNADPLKLPARCYFRFPSTEIRIQFESFLPTTVATAVHTLPTLGANTTVGTIGTVNAAAVNNNNNNNNNNNHHHHHVGNTHIIIASDDLNHSPQQQQQQQQQQHHHQLQQQQHLTQQHATSQQQQQQQQHPLHHQTPRSSLSGAAPPHSLSIVGGPPGSATHLLAVDSANAIYSPLKISIPKKEQKSPYLSPTGTISAANSCPASPRQGFHQNQANYNNYSNNNLQSQDLFQTPSTASYNHNEKPPYSYAQLIVQAISAAPDKQLTLSGIYSFIVKHYPYYRKETNKGWQNSIRHNLSLNRYFIKVARSQDEPGKGSFWRIDPDSGAKLIDHSYKKRRQRSSQGFRPPYGMPRSAPVSPSHMDNSRESSPLQDIVLQSAPGSPGLSSLENRTAEGDIIYNSQNAHQQQQSLANNTHNQYGSGSPYYVTNQNSNAIQQQQSHENNSAGVTGSGGGGSGTTTYTGNGVGALIAVKRNHVMAAGAANLVLQQQQQQQQQQQTLHPDIIYDEMPTDYSGHIESGDDDACDAAKRPKYVSEVL